MSVFLSIIYPCYQSLLAFRERPDKYISLQAVNITANCNIIPFQGYLHFNTKHKPGANAMSIEFVEFGVSFIEHAKICGWLETWYSSN